MTPEQFQRRDETIVEEEVLIIEGQTISLDESVADNLLLAIPLQVLTEEENKVQQCHLATIGLFCQKKTLQIKRSASSTS